MHLSILESSLLQSRDAIQRSRMLFTDELSHKTSNRLIRSQVLQLKKERCGDQWALVTIVFQSSPGPVRRYRPKYRHTGHE